MKLGIHVKTDRHIENIRGIVNAAVAKGHTVDIFTMAEGERLLENSKFTELSKIPDVKITFCDHNASHMGIDKTIIPKEIVCGSQYNNAVMVNKADRVIVL